jgi:hypothetical protein
LLARDEPRFKPFNIEIVLSRKSDENGIVFTWVSSSRPVTRTFRTTCMSGNVPEEGRSPADMVSSTALKAAKKELRALMKQKFSNISTESVNAQSKLNYSTLRFILLKEAQVMLSSRAL